MIIHLSHDYLFRELSEKELKKQKCPAGTNSARVFVICIRVKEVRKAYGTSTFFSTRGERKILTQL